MRAVRGGKRPASSILPAMDQNARCCHPGNLRRVLMIAFHFPPFTMSSGVQRTLRFVQHLPANGWQPIVLTAHPRAYEAVSSDLVDDVPKGTVVARAFALDAARHLSVAGRYPEFLARPDRWRCWAFGAIPTGLRLIREHRPDAIWSTYPIATAHHVAERLQRLSGLPLVCDFRDPMAQEGYPADPRTWRAFDRIERAVVRRSSRVVFVTPSARDLYRSRYSHIDPERFALIENGYDEESFLDAESEVERRPLNEGCITLLHSGIVYPSERDPRALFDALGRLRRAGRISPHNLRLRFRAPVHGALLEQLATQSETSELIEVLPALPYRAALAEMLRADGLLVMQGANCNEQIPAKLYEYFRARRPLLGLADPQGDTAKVMRDVGVAHIAKLEDPDQVERVIAGWLDAFARRQLSIPRAPDMSRRSRAQALAQVLDEVSDARRSRGSPQPC
jgi:glycosyltransferase involved in cell wall biosynthesis